MATPESLNQIINEIFALPNPQIASSRRENIASLVQSTINGDSIVDHLSFNANVKPNVMGALVYVLTDRRIVKFDIDPNDIKSVSFPLDTIIGVSRSLEGGRAGIQLSFQGSGSFGIKYTPPNPKIESFFQKVDQARGSKVSGSAS